MKRQNNYEINKYIYSYNSMKLYITGLIKQLKFGILIQDN